MHEFQIKFEKERMPGLVILHCHGNDVLVGTISTCSVCKLAVGGSVKIIRNDLVNRKSVIDQ